MWAKGEGIPSAQCCWVGLFHKGWRFHKSCWGTMQSTWCPVLWVRGGGAGQERPVGHQMPLATTQIHQAGKCWRRFRFSMMVGRGTNTLGIHMAIILSMEKDLCATAECPKAYQEHS